MVSLPSTGDTWANTLEPTLLPTAVRKGIITNIIVGDYKINGVPVNFNNCGTNSNGVFTPFAGNGALRNDLLATSVSPTLKGFSIGLTKEDGWSFDPKLTVDKTHTGQTIWSVRNDVTEAQGTLAFTARQWMPLIDLLRMDLPTLDASGTSVVPAVGTANYSVGAQGYPQLCERWIIALGFDGTNMFSITIPRCSQKELGKTQANKKDALDTMFSYDLLLDPNTNQPFIISNGGAGWIGEGAAPTTQYTVTLGTQSSGTFTLTYGGLTTTAIAFGATNTTVKAALVALDDGYSAANWTVGGSAGGPFTVTVPIPGTALTGSGASLGTPGTFVIAPV